MSIYPILFVLFHGIVIGISVTVFDVDTDTRTVLGLNEHFNAVAFRLSLELELTKGYDKIGSKRSAVWRILSDGFPTNGWRPWR